MPPARILVIDDDPLAIRELQSRLSKLGHEIVGTAADSGEAVSQFDKLKPDLILISTKHRSGSDGIKEGRFIHAQSNIPIIYITTHASQTTIRRASSTGPFGYIIKPYDDSQLFATIEIALTRHRLESQLQESRQWLNGVLMSIDDGVIAVDKAGSVRFVNSKAEAISGWKEADAIGRKLFEILPLRNEASGELLDLSSEIFDVRGKNRSGDEIEALLISNDGSDMPLEINFNPIIDQENNLQGLVLAFRDITSRRKTINQLKQQTSRAEALVKVAEQLNSRLDFNVVLDIVCTVTNQVFNTSVTMIFLYDPKTNLFRDMARKVNLGNSQTTPDPANITFDRDTLQAFLPDDKSGFCIPDVRVRRDLPFRHVLRLFKIRSLAFAPLVRNQGVIGLLICGSKDDIRYFSPDELDLLKGLANHVTIAVSNASMFEQVRKGRERQRELAKGLVDIQESERRHIARELHDHLGQALTGLQFMLESLKNKASDAQRQELEDTQLFVRDIIEKVREMSLNLRPSMLDDLGLIPTLKWHFERYTSQTDIKVHFQSDEVLSRLPAEIETVAYRIIQEALTNVARYAQVRDVFIGLALQNNTLWVEVLDYGKGFDASGGLGKPTTGLGGMRERADLVGGYLAVNSYINQGTQVLAALPLTNKPLERRKSDRNGLSGG